MIRNMYVTRETGDGYGSEVVLSLVYEKGK